jgi:hypothetical protein
MERVISLNGQWQLAVDPKNVGRQQQWGREPRPEARPAPVPWIIQGPFPGYHGVAWYWRRIAVPEHAWGGGRYLLRFHAVDYLADVWVNHTHVGSHEGGETPFTLDITSAVRAGEETVLAVRVLNPTNEPIDGIRLAETPHRNKVIPYRTGGSFGYGGILESVELVLAPPVRIDDLFVRADPATGQLRARLALHNDQDSTVAGLLQLTVAPATTGQALAQVAQPVSCPPGDTSATLQVPLSGPRLWELADPFLYRVTVRLEAPGAGEGAATAAGGGRAAGGWAGFDERSVRVGFRDFRVEGGYFRLNGRRLFVRSTHTGNHSPLGQVLAPAAAPDLLRRDLVYAKASGYNMVRFIAGIAHPEQLDLADELGLMVYEESLAGWCLVDSPHMADRWDRSLGEMVRRDRNHPSVVVWGLLNETQDTPVFRRALASLPRVRALDDSRLVLLSSGRWDGQWGTGSVCNPDGEEWVPAWGAEDEGAAPCGVEGTFIPAYKPGAGDAHMYPSVPQTAQVEDFIRTVGRDTRPVFVSEYGIGSLMNAVRELRHYEQAGADPQAEDAVLMRHMAVSLEADWERYGFGGVYAFAEDMLQDSQRRHARHRLVTFDLIRSNPAICGYNVTGMLDHGMTGEGLWTFWREWKPGALDALADGWAPVRWCLFARPLHGYTDQPVVVEAVLANEDVVGPGTYPVRLRLMGPSGVLWQSDRELLVPPPRAGEEPSLALPVARETVVVDGPPGEHEWAASMVGAAPAGGRLRLYRSDPVGPVRLPARLTLWGVTEAVAEWLRSHGVEGRDLAGSGGDGAADRRPAGGAAGNVGPAREVILVGGDRRIGRDLDGWRQVLARVDRGAVALFAAPEAFARGRERVGSLEISGILFPNVADATVEIENASSAEQAVFRSEVQGDIAFLLSGLPAGEYEVEMGWCELVFTEPAARLFDVAINGRTVATAVDLYRQAGGRFRALTQRFAAQPQDGQIRVQLTSKKNLGTVCRLRLYDRAGALLMDSDQPARERDRIGWLPLANKGQCNDFWDWLYHREFVARRHPAFADLPGPGILDWDYFGPVLPSRMFTGQDTPDEVAAAAFAVGYPCPGGYAAGVVLGEYRFGVGRFLLNCFRLLDNVGAHPAADRLLVNLLQHAARTARRPRARPGRDLDGRLQAIGYV